MKVGAENRNVVIATAAVAALAIVLVIRMIAELSGPTAAAAPSTAAGPTGRPAQHINRGAQGKLPAANSLDPTLKLDLLKASEQAEYKGSGRNIFAVYEAPIEKAPDPRIDKHAQKGPAPMQCPGDPRCPPPPIPLKFTGYSTKPGEGKKVFLLSTDGDVFIAAEGEIVNRRYRVLHIGVNSVEIEDVLQNNRQTIPLTQG
jgi:hypothetical protein